MPAPPIEVSAEGGGPLGIAGRCGLPPDGGAEGGGEAAAAVRLDGGAADDERFAEAVDGRVNGGAGPVGTLLCVPIARVFDDDGEGPLGACELVNKAGGAAFDAVDEGIARSLAQAAALAISNWVHARALPPRAQAVLLSTYSVMTTVRRDATGKVVTGERSVRLSSEYCR